MILGSVGLPVCVCECVCVCVCVCVCYVCVCVCLNLHPHPSPSPPNAPPPSPWFCGVLGTLWTEDVTNTGTHNQPNCQGIPPGDVVVGKDVHGHLGHVV